MRSLTLARSCLRRESSLLASLPAAPVPPAREPAPETALLLGLVADDVVAGGTDAPALEDVVPGAFDAVALEDVASG